ncbi:TfuA-like protein [Actinoallomurus sp. CA-150999]|uniref:TfuA-like protein n=1 Tax=Actinoallomurus sp. CA-150999 TaxID=3239887 RepID=UPI003D90A4FC
MTTSSPALHVFIGPTLTAARVRSLGPTAIVHPPVQHGDLLRLATSPGDTVVIIDGLWHQVPPVRHKEILELLASGVTVIGAASMGALRAAELAPYGMVGVGWVYEQYASSAIDADDEVAVAHTPEGRPLSTALVCIRYALSAAADVGIITRSDVGRLLDRAQALPFQRRTWRALKYVTTGDLAEAYELARAWLDAQGPAVTNVKALDAELAIAQAVAGQLPTAVPPGWQAEPWRTSHLRRWIATYRPAAHTARASVPFLAVLNHAQLYDPAFPARWRRHVLAWIAAQSPAARNVEDQALAAAHARGLDSNALTPGQIGYWATPGEIVSLCQRELLLRILVRSARMDPTASVWPETPAEAAGLLDADTAARAAVTAWTTNERVAATGPGRTLEHLDPKRIHAHLASQWGIHPSDTAALTAAARDRGILSLPDAVEAARPFYLAARATSLTVGTTRQR